MGDIHRVKISRAEFPQPFESGLEYNPPARGVWNIVHTGMLIPQSRQIFICARGCLRGVILTAAEMNASDRMSWVSVEDRDMYDGTMEESVIEGVSDILNRLDSLPPVVLVFLSCIHLFSGCDFENILQELRGRFPTVKFTDCYMTPTMRKTISPDAKMREQLYSFLQPCEKNDKTVAVIGNDYSTNDSSELFEILKDNGYKVMEITRCKDYKEYEKMAESCLNITYLPNAVNAGEDLKKRLGTEHIHIPAYFNYDKIEDNYAKLCDVLKIALPDLSKYREKAKEAVKEALDKIGGCAVAIDFTAVTQPFGLARFLSENGFNVKYIFADVISLQEKDDFEYLARNFGEIEIFSVVNTGMLFSQDEFKDEKILAIGQKAAYYCGTNYFVNIVNGSGGYGYEGIEKICSLMEQAFELPKDMQKEISFKGLGCESCLR